MKIIVTGSLGNISKPLTLELIKQGHEVTVISSNVAKQKDIEALGATPAIGSLDDINFLKATFNGADSAYCMIPPNYTVSNMIDYYHGIGKNYAVAIEQSGVKHVVHLSSFGAHLDKGTGLILGSHDVETTLNKLAGISITHMRPTYFYYNLLAFIDVIKKTGSMTSNYGGEDRIPLVSPTDIAAAVADEIVSPHAGVKIRYVVSDEQTANDIAAMLGAAIDKPDLNWTTMSDEQMLKRYESSGMPASLATGLVEMHSSLHSGMLAQDYYLNKPVVMGKVKMENYAKEFAAIFKQK